MSPVGFNRLPAIQSAGVITIVGAHALLVMLLCCMQSSTAEKKGILSQLEHLSMHLLSAVQIHGILRVMIHCRNAMRAGRAAESG